jgi:chromosome segregation ATPase
MPVMEMIRKAFTTQRRSLTEQYDAIVDAVASGDDYDELAALDVLNALNRTADDVERDAERLKKRREAAETIKRAEAAQRELHRLEAERNQLAARRTAEVDAIDARYRPQFAANDAARIEAQAEAAGEANARRLLAQTADPKLTARVADLMRLRVPVLERIEGLRGNLEVLNSSISRNESQLESVDLGDEARKSIKRLAESQKQSRDGQLKALAAAESNLADLNAEIASLEARKYLP